MTGRPASSTHELSSDQYRQLIYKNNGSSPFSVWYATQIFLDVHLTNLLVQKLPSANEWLANVAFILVPCILRTLVPFNLYHLAFNCAEILAILVLRNWRSPPTNPADEQSSQWAKHSSLLTILRSSLFLITSIAILAVDFRIFHLPFAKTDRYGYSLMDTGIGLFTLVNGSSHRQLKLSRIGWLLALGISRFCAVKMTGYRVNVTEYGVHWNFFLTMFVLKIGLNFVRVRRPLLMSAIVAGVYEIVLYWLDWKTIVFEPDAGRETFLSANREGIYTLPGFLALYLFGIYMRSLIEAKSRVRSLAGVAVAALALHFAGGSVLLQPSRKLVNLGYSLWIVFVGCSIAASLVLVPVRNVPLVLRIVNSNSLAYFLVANLLTGAINLLVDTLAITNPVVSFATIFAYSLVLIRIFSYFLREKIKYD